MKQQPDFNKLFYDYFGQTPQKVQYEIRYGPSRDHDVIFLRSLLHDARFNRDKIRIRGDRLTIPINRDCWELKYTELNKHVELHIADAELIIFPVENIQWTFDNNLYFGSNSEFSINNLALVNFKWVSNFY